MDFSVASLVPSLLFSLIGFFVFREGKRQLNFPLVLVGMALMVYSYLMPTVLLNWLVGAGLCGLAYHYRR